jgi:DNA-directed RNA polymerase specialized sigma24 family protein
MAIVVIAMKWVLMDYGRKHRRRPVLVQIPSGDLPPEPFAREMAVEDLLILNIALERLAAWDVRKARVMELRFFGGLTNEEIAQVLEIASNTVIKDVRCAEAWLYHEMAVIKDNDTDTMEDN